jgi:uridine kinase
MTPLLAPFLLAIDGPSGSGKTTYAHKREAEYLSIGESVEVIHLDDLYGGWSDPLGEKLEKTFTERVIPGLASGKEFTLPVFNWHTNSWGPEKLFLPADRYIIEGVGAFLPILRPYVSEAVWIECDEQVGFLRAIARDGEEIRGELTRFMESQRHYFSETSPSQFADYLIPTQGI